MREINKLKIHFVGANGASLSGLIRISKYLGAEVSGSDNSFGGNMLALTREGFNVYSGIKPDIASKADLVVYSSAVRLDHPEVKAGKRIMPRGEFLGLISQSFKYTVAVAGTHGKSTVTAMISHVLDILDYPFVAHIGGSFISKDSGVILKGRDIFITEACEYKDSFLSLSPDIGIITNIDYDHPDYFKDFSSYLNAFCSFAKKVKKQLIVGKDINITNAHLRTFALDRQFFIKCENAHLHTCIFRQEDSSVKLFTPLDGGYNLENLAIALKCLTLLGTPIQKSVEALQSFKGLRRRRELIGYYNGCEVYSDYAHHPTQIEKLISSFKGNKKIAVVFEPHTYSRTKELMNSFAKSLSLADYLILLPVYSAREEYDEEGSSERLYNKITIENKVYCKNYNELVQCINSLKIKNAMLLFVGAGSIDELARSTAVDVTS